MDDVEDKVAHRCSKLKINDAVRIIESTYYDNSGYPIDLSKGE